MPRFLQQDHCVYLFTTHLTSCCDGKFCLRSEQICLDHSIDKRFQRCRIVNRGNSSPKPQTLINSFNLCNFVALHRRDKIQICFRLVGDEKTFPIPKCDKTTQKKIYNSINLFQSHRLKPERQQTQLKTSLLTRLEIFKVFFSLILPKRHLEIINNKIITLSAFEISFVPWLA